MDQEDLLLAIVAEAQEDREAIQGLKETVQALIGQNDKQLEKLPRVVREVLSAVPGELRKGVTEGSGEILREVMRPAVGEAKELVKSLKAAATEAQASAKALRRTGIILGFFLLGAGLAVGLIGWKAMGLMVESRTQELDQVKAEFQAIDHELAKTANVQSFTDKDGKASFWVEIDPTEKPGESGGKTWARMPKR